MRRDQIRQSTPALTVLISTIKRIKGNFHSWAYISNVANLKPSLLLSRADYCCTKSLISQHLFSQLPPVECLHLALQWTFYVVSAPTEPRRQTVNFIIPKLSNTWDYYEIRTRVLLKWRGRRGLPLYGQEVLNLIWLNPSQISGWTNWELSTLDKMRQAFVCNQLVDWNAYRKYVY